MSATSLNRREFVRWIGIGASGPLILSGRTLGLNGAVAANDRIRVGTVGLGARGLAVMGAMMRKPEVEMAAVCDVDRLHYRDGAWGKGRPMGREPGLEYVKKFYAKRDGVSAAKVGVTAYEDYRELCARSDLDAVIVATPDHWHALIALAAVRNGKDVYCEKPVTHTFLEGQLLYREVAQFSRVFQTGSQQRSDWRFRRAVELVRNGHLGRLRHVKVGLPAGYANPMGDTDLVTPPETLNYSFWCGPSPMLPYMRARHHRFWRGHSAFGGGNIMDWIGHHHDIAHWGLDLDASGPLKLESRNWTFPESTVYNVPIEFDIQCEYPGGVKGSIASSNRMGTTFVGEEGEVYVNRGKLETPRPEWAEQEFDLEGERVDRSDDHIGNFLECMQSRKTCVASAEIGHRSITPGHLGFVSQQLGRVLNWDPKAEAVVGDPEANAILRTANYRSPWQLR